MEEEQCVEPSCKLSAEYACQCISSETYFCEKHFIIHCKISKIAHAFDPVFVHPVDGTKEAILSLLAAEKSRQDDSRRKLLDSFSHNLSNSESSFEDLLKRLDSDSAEISHHFERISKAQKVSKLEKDPVLKLLILHPDEAVEKFKVMIPTIIQPHHKTDTFCGLSGEIEKMIESSIKNYFGAFFESRLLKIEKSLYDHSREINLNKNVQGRHIKELKEFILDLTDTTSKSLKDFEDWKRAIELKSQNDVILLNPQLSNIEDFSRKLSSIEELNKKISDINEKQLNEENLLLDSKISELNAKRAEILSRSNDSEIEKEFRQTYLLYEDDLKEACTSSPALAKAYQDYIGAYHQKTSLFTTRKINQKMYLAIYDTESSKEEIKELNTPEKLNWDTCMTQLPNGEIFCYGNDPPSGITLIIDCDYEARILPSGKECASSSAIYFNKSVYCFGGEEGNKCLRLSERFDLNENRWYELTQMPVYDRNCYSIVFDGDILISGFNSSNILRYSVNSNSFITVSFEFAKETKKILINSERLYLIECQMYMYESDIGSCSTWNLAEFNRLKCGRLAFPAFKCHLTLLVFHQFPLASSLC